MANKNKTTVRTTDIKFPDSDTMATTFQMLGIKVREPCTTTMYKFDGELLASWHVEFCKRHNLPLEEIITDTFKHNHKCLSDISRIFVLPETLQLTLEDRLIRCTTYDLDKSTHFKNVAAFYRALKKYCPGVYHTCNVYTEQGTCKV